MPAAAAHEAPATESHEEQPAPCCPSPTAACTTGLCATPAIALLPAVISATPATPVAAASALRVADWVSYTHAPDPPPPRA